MDNTISLCEQMICPKHPEGCKFMWYTKLNDDTMIYEYDDRKPPETLGSKIRDKYASKLFTLEQKYFRRDIGPLELLKFHTLSIIDSLLLYKYPELKNPIKESKFDQIDQKDIIELGIMGCKGKIFFKTTDGVINLGGGKELSVFLENIDTGELYYITDNLGDSVLPEENQYKLIEQHNISYEFDLMKSGMQESSGKLTGLEIGYQRKKEYSRNTFFDFKLTYTLPTYNPGFLTVSIISPIDMQAKLHLRFLANDITQVINLPIGQKQTYSMII